MAINKVQFGNNTLIDLTGTTATSDKILTGYGAFGKDGVWMDGSLVPGADDGYVYQDEDNYVVLDDDEGIGVGVTPLSVSANGTYNAGSRRAYNPVTVNVQPALQSKTVTPTESQQTITPDSGKYGLSQVVVNGIDAGYVGSSVPRKSSANLTISDYSVIAPAGYYSGNATINLGAMIPTTATTSSGELWDTIHATNTQVYVNMPKGYNNTSRYARIYADAGKATTPATTITANPTISVNSSGLITATAAGTSSVTPTVSAGYVSTGTAGTITVSGSATSQLTTKGATTYTPTTTNQTIASGTYLTGAQTISGDSNLVAENIKKDVTIFGITGTAETEPTLIAKTVTPTAETQIVTPSETPNLNIEEMTPSSFSFTTGSTWNITWATPLVNGEKYHVYLDFYREGYSRHYIYDGEITFSGFNFNIVATVPGGSTTATTTFVFKTNQITNSLHAEEDYQTGMILSVLIGKQADGLSQVTVNGDADLVAGNIKKDVEIFGVTGTYEGRVNLTTKTVTPKTTQQTITTTSGDVSETLIADGSNGGGFSTGTSSTSSGVSLQLAYNVPLLNNITITFPIRVHVHAIVERRGSASGFLTNVSVIDGEALLLEAGPAYEIEGMLPDECFSTITIAYQTGNGFTIRGTSIEWSYYKTRTNTVNEPENFSIYEVKEAESSEYVGLSQVTVAPIPADYTYMADLFTYLIGNTTYTLYGSSGIILPSNIQMLGLGAFAFKNMQYISSPYVLSIGQSAFYAAQNLSSVNFPNVLCIANYAFANCYKLSEISFPAVQSIGASRFVSCSSLTTAYIPNVVSLGSYAFSPCSRLTQIDVPLLSIIEYATFSSCSRLTTVSASSVTTVTSYAFTGCSNLVSINMPKVTYIGRNRFAMTGISSIYLQSCSYIAVQAFAGCQNLSQVNFPEVTVVSGYAFSNCSNLVDVSLPNASSVGSYAFASCSALTSIKLPVVSYLGASAFLSCYELRTVILGSVYSMFSYTFSRCYNLLSLYLLGSSMASGAYATNMFFSTPISGYTTSTGGVYGSIFVPASLYSSYIARTGWKSYSSRFVSLTDAQISAILNS